MPLLPRLTRKPPNAAPLATVTPVTLTDGSLAFNVSLTQDGERVLTIAAENHYYAVHIANSINAGASWFSLPGAPLLNAARSC
jgi:hypothetical protein